MASQKRNKNQRRPIRPATTPEGRESQMVSLAVDLAEQQMQDGSASAQVISHYLKLGSTRERLEQERLTGENELLRAKIGALASAKNVEELYGQALQAMRSYSGQDEPMELEESYDHYDD